MKNNGLERPGVKLPNYWKQPNQMISEGSAEDRKIIDIHTRRPLVSTPRLLGNWRFLSIDDLMVIGGKLGSLFRRSQPRNEETVDIHDELTKAFINRLKRQQGEGQ